MTIPTDDPLWGAKVRVQWAREQLNELRTLLGNYEVAQEERISYDFDPQTKQLAINGAPLDPPPINASKLISQIAQHLRSAVDYLIFELSWRNKGHEVDGTQFPIESTKQGFAVRRKSYLKALTDSQVTIIEKLQPFDGCDWTQRLRDLSNPDKHRYLTLIANFSRAGIRLSAGEPGDFDGDVSGRVYQTHGPNGEPMDMKVEYLPGTFIQFRDGTGVLESLEQLVSRVADTLETFASEF